MRLGLAVAVLVAGLDLHATGRGDAHGTLDRPTAVAAAATHPDATSHFETSPLAAHDRCNACLIGLGQRSLAPPAAAGVPPAPGQRWCGADFEHLHAAHPTVPVGRGPPA